MMYGLDIGPVAFARLVGLSFSMVMKVKAGKRKYSPENCRRIVARTGGRVTKEMLRPDIWSTDDFPDTAA
jgi:DNA-binding transcriptional regulator YdaS (Cro superfamily)